MLWNKSYGKCFLNGEMKDTDKYKQNKKLTQNFFVETQCNYTMHIDIH